MILYNIKGKCTKNIFYDIKIRPFVYNSIKLDSKEKMFRSPRKRAILTTMYIFPHLRSQGILFTFSFKAFSFENKVILFHSCNYVASKQVFVFKFCT